MKDGYEVNNLFGSILSSFPLKSPLHYKFTIKLNEIVNVRIGFAPLIADYNKNMLLQGGFGIANQAFGLQTGTICLCKSHYLFKSVGNHALEKNDLIRI